MYNRKDEYGADYYPELSSEELQEQWFKSRVMWSRIDLATEGRYSLASFEVVPGSEKAVKAVKNFMSENRLHFFLTLIGEPGTGKSHLTFAIVWHFLRTFRPEGDVQGLQKCRTVLYYQVEDMLDELRRTFNPSSEMALYTYDSIIERMKTVDILVLDDLGAEQRTEWARAKLDMIIDYRYLHEKPTVVTVNMAKEKLSDRIASRLGEGIIVTMECGDYRARKAERRGAKHGACRKGKVK